MRPTLKTILFLGCSLVAGLLRSQSVAAQNLTFADIEKLPKPTGSRRFSYGSDPLQFGELRLPAIKGPYPVVIVIHGGCWYSEYDLNHIANFSASLTKLGVATWSLEYRRIGNAGGGWPGTFLDVANGIDYLRVLAHSFPLDLKRVIVVGHSAGGELALWAAARHRLPKSSPLYLARPLSLKGIVSLAGITDMRKYETKCGGAVKKLLGGSPEEVPERYRQTSPMELVPLRIEQRLIQGTLDQIVPETFSRDYEAAARKKGDHVRLATIATAGHFDLIAPHSSAWPAVEDAVRYLLRLDR